VPVPDKLLVNKCDLFGDDPKLVAFPYYLKSHGSLSASREVISVLEGTTVKVMNNNFRGLSQLCEEFLFRDFSGWLPQFRET
jgi:hypothetical protein